MEEFKWRGMEKPKRLIVKEERNLKNHAKFIVEPLERGYGVTLGNSLRRVLLSSIPGAAVSSVKFNSVLHEFSAISGVREDTVEIILNIKKLLIKMHGNGPEKIYVKLKGPMEIKAGDIECSANIEILNQDLYLMNLDKNVKFEMEMEVTRGRGYIPAIKNKKAGMPIGVIPVDAIYSPVKKVNYYVENARVGQLTDYDRLILEIWTSGSITPEDAVAYSAKILKDHLTILINFDEEPEKEVIDTEKEEVDKINELLGKSVDELELSVRSYNCLKAANIKTIRDLVLRSETDMLKFRNFGRKSLTEIKDILKSMGISFDLSLDSSGRVVLDEKGVKKE